MYIYLIVTVVATCNILIRTSVLESFDQQAFKAEIRGERNCKEDGTYRPDECNDWYKELCVDERNELHPFFATDPENHMKAACIEYIRNLVV